MSELTKYIEEQQLEINDLKAELQNYQDSLKLVVGVGVSFFIAAYLAVIVR
jgi:hypothetical protein